MNSAIRSTAILFAAAGGIIAATLALAGPLNPPAGAVSATYKTLGEVEPRIAINQANTPGDALSVFKITQPGSYYLTGNLSVQASITGIVVQSSDVTIDLGGFTISGMSNSYSAIASLGFQGQNLVVRNGTVRGFSYGLSLYSMSGGRIERVHVAGSYGQAMSAMKNGLLLDCTAQQCTLEGFRIETGTNAVNCTASNIAGIGFNITGGECTLSHCRAESNTSYGFAASSSTVFDHCASDHNGQDGFAFGDSSKAESCTAYDNTGVGFRMGAHTSAESCDATYNASNGFILNDSASIRHCRALNNGGNSAAGIWLMGAGTHAENNESSNNHFGIYVGAATTGTFATGNCCRNNSGGNYAGGWAAATNQIAPVIANPGAANFAGATAWSNFSY